MGLATVLRLSAWSGHRRARRTRPRARGTTTRGECEPRAHFFARSSLEGQDTVREGDRLGRKARRTTMNLLTDDLRTLIATGEVVIVVGAGVSIAATAEAPAASWIGLLEKSYTQMLWMRVKRKAAYLPG